MGGPVRQKGIMAGIGTGGSRRLIGQGQEMDIARENKPWESLRVALLASRAVDGQACAGSRLACHSLHRIGAEHHTGVALNLA